MKVTRIEIKPLSNNREVGRLADCTIVLDDCLQVNHIHIIKGTKGLFVSFPNTGETRLVNNQRRFSDIVHPVNTELRSHIEEAILSKYREMN